jgi:hypothetical protein
MECVADVRLANLGDELGSRSAGELQRLSSVWNWDGGSLVHTHSSRRAAVVNRYAGEWRCSGGNDRRQSHTSVMQYGYVLEGHMTNLFVASSCIGRSYV